MEGIETKREELNIVNVCPKEHELDYVGVVACPTCSVVFQNKASCELHQIKRHKKESEFLLKKPSGNYRYFCPIDGCKYNSTWKERYFNKLKYLRQHYLKSHAVRKFACTKCNKQFPTQVQLVAHITKECGVKFNCIQCNLTYNSREALLTHCSRSGHAKKPRNSNRKDNVQQHAAPAKQFRTIIAKPSQPSAHLMENIAAAALSELSCQPVLRSGLDKMTQTEAKPKRWNLLEASTSTQTEKERIFPEADSDSLMTDIVFRQYFTSATQTNQDMVFDLGMFQEDIDQHVHNETQTELLPANLMLDEVCPALSDTHTQTAPAAAIDDFSHNCTQTCDDALFNDFVELSDIETQTAWASLNVDSLLVSAQTQTLQ